MKWITFFLLLVLTGQFTFGQSAKKRNKLLLAECASEKQKQDSALALFLSTKHQFDSAKLEFNSNVGFMRKREIRLTDLFLTTSGLSYQLRLLEVEPVPAIIPDYQNRRFTAYPEFIKPMEKTIQVFAVFERVLNEVKLDGLSRKEQNMLLDKKIGEYRRYAVSNSIKQGQMEAGLNRLLAFLPRMDSLIGAYDLLAEELVRGNSRLQQKMDELEANFRKKGPEGFSYGYHRVFPELFPGYFPPLEEADVNTGVVAGPEDWENAWNNSNPVVVENSEPEIFDWAEEPAEFPGGMSALKKYLATNLVYPRSVIEANISGKVVVRFVVSDKGVISDVKLVRGIPDCTECDAEVIRVMNTMPKWIPGRINGKVVNSYFSLPIYFDPK